MSEVSLLPNYGYISDTMPDSLLTKVKDMCSRAKDFALEANHALVGQIEEEWKINTNLIDPEIRAYIHSNAMKYATTWNYLDTLRCNKSSYPIDILDMWVNYQKKTEYNPIHNHSGVFSFVMWIDIPFSYDEEGNYSTAAKANTPQRGTFQFHYTNVLGGIVHHPLEAKAGDFVMFPAGLMHSVYPFFTSDSYRVSVSGNLCYMT